MKRVFLVATFLASFGATNAYAQMETCTTDSGGNSICDPTAFHVGTPGATGTDPVLLNNNKTFTITEVGNHDINSPVRILFLEPAGTNTADITSVDGQMASLVTTTDPLGKFSFGATGIAALGAFNTTTDTFSGPAVTLSSGQDLVKQIGFNGGAASISYANIDAEYMLLGLTVPKTFDVFDAIVPVNFTSDSDFLTVNGAFIKGTVISAIALDITAGAHGNVITVYDNSWTTAGFVNTTAVIPEPSTWVMMIVGFGVLGLIGWRSKFVFAG